MEPPRLPPGTQVVLRHPLPASSRTAAPAGSTGRVVGDAGAGYLVRLADGRHVTADRAALTLRRAHQGHVALGTDRGDAHDLVRDRTILAVVVGSRAFGLATESSDEDTRGVYVAPTAAWWRLVKPPPHVEGPDPEWFSWEVERFCELALKANPNLLEVLASPLVVRETPLGAELRSLRGAFVSQLAYQTFNGYVLSQLTAIEADLRRTGTPRWKHVMHLLRLLLSAESLLATGEPLLDVGPHRERLLAVRRGELPWDEVERWRRSLHGRVDDALDRTVLPPAPDVARVEEWLVSVRRRDLGGASGPGHPSGDDQASGTVRA